MDHALLQAYPQPYLGSPDEILVQLYEAGSEGVEQAHDQLWLVDGAAGGQEGDAAVTLLLHLMPSEWHADLPEGEVKDVGQALLRRIFPARSRPL
jgi:hypothetical protein